MLGTRTEPGMGVVPRPSRPVPTAEAPELTRGDSASLGESRVPPLSSHSPGLDPGQDKGQPGPHLAVSAPRAPTSVTGMASGQGWHPTEAPPQDARAVLGGPA